MALIIWNDDLSVGIRQIDDQHKELIRLINLLNESIILKNDNKISGEIINDLINFVEYHFSYEENLFLTHGFSESESHLKMHKYLKNQVLKIQYSYNFGKTDASAELLNLLKDWLINHLINVDKRYGKFLNEKGIF